MMTGWKTWLGAGLVGASAVLKALGHDDNDSLKQIGEVVLYAGNAFGLLGIGHKIEKVMK